MKNSIKIILSIVSILIIIMLCHNKLRTHLISYSENVDQTQVSELTSPAKNFSWRYEDGGEDVYGLPQTQIFLDVGYENGKTISKMVDKVQGSCNDIDPSTEDKDMVEDTTKIQCYAAGFGEWYKILKGDNDYEVYRKYFTEAEPDVIPPIYEYQMVAEFSLTE